MFLFIFESIGTQELLLIGIVALIFLGPRRMPEMARKLGKIMSDFKNTTSEFKSTWEREVNFEKDSKRPSLGVRRPGRYNVQTCGARKLDPCPKRQMEK